MPLLFCQNPFDLKTADPDFEEEYQSALAVGVQPLLFSYERLTRDKDGEGAINRISPSKQRQGLIYRGWMLKPGEYARLYTALEAKNYQLVNSPKQYQHCHYLPDSYPFIAEHTPKTVWVKLAGTVDYETIFQAIASFGNAPLILKDFVKSQKHYWQQACYIPSAQDKAKVESVVDRFLELQGADLNEGLVFRAFIPLADLAVHSKSGMPLKQEYRLFFLHHQLVGCYPYWEEGEYAVEEPPLDRFLPIAQGVDSHFFSMDVAKTQHGDWLIIELGDGQVAGLPERADKNLFYQKLRAIALPK